MDLPQELLDEIIGYIPRDDQQSLRNCSLVAKSWVNPSRRRLFEAVSVAGKFLKLWLATISPTNVGVLQHVRWIVCQIREAPHEPHGSVDVLRDYSPSFRQLEHLTFYAGFLPSLTQIGTYAAFQHTVTYLRLQACDVSPDGIVALVNYFPNLAQLELIDLYTYRP